VSPSLEWLDFNRRFVSWSSESTVLCLLFFISLSRNDTISFNWM
jgi:hypothetical protein